MGGRKRNDDAVLVVEGPDLLSAEKKLISIAVTAPGSEFSSGSDEFLHPLEYARGNTPFSWQVPLSVGGDGVCHADKAKDFRLIKIF